ncbi:DUF2726 domain-containing protein [Wohlfahrtiimonas larvae]|uniref:DUF2726 domain-containing protein n=1 Tax=Wohlfahrtiimonas larvae TaxID=1157986 RepID=A0ABP9MNZ1_9GAMM|nr:DUF2726 domain-containing protein [Wohlfahrtiimonas larvae]
MFFKIFFTIFVVIGLVFLFKFKRTRPQKVTGASSCEKNIPNAFRTKTSALSIDEQNVLKFLQEIVQYKDHIQVFPKPQLTTFITLDPNLASEIQTRLEQELKQISCDFMLVNTRTFSPIVALSINPSENLEKLLQDLNIPLISLRKGLQYDQEKLQQLVVHYL